MQQTKPQSTQAPPSAEALRKKVLADEHTTDLAKQLGISLEEYVDHVVRFLLHPQEEPNLYVVKDEDLRAAGLEPPDPAEMGRFVTEAARIAQAAEGMTEFVSARRAPVQLNDPRPAPSDGSREQPDPRLTFELQKVRSSSQGNRG